jgi:hypothetical protein
MFRRIWSLAAAGITCSAFAQAPFKLSLAPQEPQSVYALPAPTAEDAGVNAGGVNLNMKLNYISDYVYRGVDQADFVATALGDPSKDLNAFQFEGELKFDLGKLPHPFVGVFINAFDSDPVSNFQEIRPILGAEWSIRPIVFAFGHNAYLFPDRDDLDTGEVWGRITFDDAAILRNDEPLLSPYVLAAYDYDNYKGWYLEAGVKHDFHVENTGLTLTPVAGIAYVIGHSAFAGEDPEEDTGLQHYQVGLIGKYSLNLLLNIPPRYGQWSFNGYIYYTDGIDNDLRADTQLRGGAGIEFSY